jgi:hypothetical protein
VAGTETLAEAAEAAARLQRVDEEVGVLEAFHTVEDEQELQD